MTNGRPTPRDVLERDFNIVFDELNKAVEKCDNSALEWAMSSIRSNEKALCKKEITESTYLERQQKVTNLIADFSYNCECSHKASASEHML